MEKLNVNRCGKQRGPYQPEDAAHVHLWGSEPTVEITECGPVAWWLCGRCPARVLHDPETEDGMPAEPIVVYPPSCFDTDPDAWRRGERCDCPGKASGDVAHLEGCVAAAIEEHLREPVPEPSKEVGPVPDAWLRRRREREEREHVPEPAAIVHPPTDPAPPSEELAQAIEDADEDDIPTLTRITPVTVESASSIFDRVEALFGRPILDDERAETALSRVEWV